MLLHVYTCFGRERIWLRKSPHLYDERGRSPVNHQTRALSYQPRMFSITPGRLPINNGRFPIEHGNSTPTRYGNMVTPFEMMDAMDDGTANIIEKVMDMRETEVRLRAHSSIHDQTTSTTTAQPRTPQTTKHPHNTNSRIQRKTLTSWGACDGGASLNPYPRSTSTTAQPH